MKNLILIFVLISLSVMRLQAQEELTGLAGLHSSYDSDGKIGGLGFETAGIGKTIGFGFQAEYFINTKSDSLSFYYSGVFFLIPVTEDFLIKLNGGVKIQNPKEKRYPDYYPSAGFGFVRKKPGFYWGLQCNIDFQVAPTVSLLIGIPFSNSSKKSD